MNQISIKYKENEEKFQSVQVAVLERKEQVHRLSNKIKYINSFIKEYDRFLAILPCYLQELGTNDYKEEIKSIRQILKKINEQITEKQVFERGSIG